MKDIINGAIFSAAEIISEHRIKMVIHVEVILFLFSMMIVPETLILFV